MAEQKLLIRGASFSMWIHLWICSGFPPSQAVHFLGLALVVAKSPGLNRVNVKVIHIGDPGEKTILNVDSMEQRGRKSDKGVASKHLSLCIVFPLYITAI